MNKFEKAYKLVKDNIGCKIGCEICEKHRPLVFFPGEADYLSKKLKVPKSYLANKYKCKGHIFWMIKSEDPHCNYFKCKKFLNRNMRPLDCRLYPVVINKTKNHFNILLDNMCPLVQKNKIPKTFIDKVRKVYKLINPPQWWLDIYYKEHIIKN